MDVVRESANNFAQRQIEKRYAGREGSDVGAVLSGGASAMQGYNFTERVRKVLAMAREESVRLQHEYVGTEHMLLGIIREGGGVAATVLQNLGVELDEIRQKIEETVKRGKATQTTGPDLPYTSRAKKVLELAMSEARALNHSYVGTEHLLLGLLAEARGLAAQVLGSFGVTLEKARAEMSRILGTEMSPPQPIPEPPPGAKPAEIRLILRYSNGAVVMKNFTDATDAANFLSGL